MLLLSANRVFMLTSTLRDILIENERFYSSVILNILSDTPILLCVAVGR